MTRILALDLEDIIDGDFDQQLPANWRYTIICSYMQGMCRPERLPEMILFAFVDTRAPFPSGVFEYEAPDSFDYLNERAYPPQYEFVGVCILPTKMTRDAIHEYLFYEAFYKRWTRYYSLKPTWTEATDVITSQRMFTNADKIDDHDTLPVYTDPPAYSQ